METIQAECIEKVSALKNNLIQLEAKHERLSASHSKSFQSQQNGVDKNEQYKCRDTLILSGPSLPQETDNENCKQIVRNLIQNHLRLNLNPTDVSIAQRFGRTASNNSTKRNNIFKLCQRDLTGENFQPVNNSSAILVHTNRFLVNESLTPLPKKFSRASVS